MDPAEINIAREFIRFCYTVKKNYILAFFLPVLGMFAGIGWYAPKQRYESSMLMETSLLNESEAAFLFAEFQQADSIPGLDRDHEKMIRRMSFGLYQLDATPKTAVEEKTTYIRADISVSDTLVFKPLQGAIMAFLVSNPSFQRNKAERDQFYSGIINKIDTEIAELQIAKKDISAKASNSILNPADLYSTAVNLERMRSEYSLRKQKLNSPVNVVKDFRTLPSETLPSFLKVAVIGFVLGVIVFFGILALKAFIKFYLRFEKEVA